MLMRVRFFLPRVLAAVVVLSGPVLGYVVATRRMAGSPHNPHHVYRLDYLVSVSQPGRAVLTSAYTMNVEDGSTGDLHAGANIPLQASKGPTSPRQDVGLRLVGHVTRVGEDLLLHNSTEISAPGDDDSEEGARSIRKVSATDDAVVSPGKTTLVARLEEPASHARYEVTVNAVKLR
jgi:hypothetical protein